MELEHAIDLSVYRNIVDVSPAPTVITDTSGNILYVNEEFCKVTGYTKDEVVGKNPNILKSGQHSPEFYDKLWTTIKNGDVWAGEICNKAKDGKLYWEKGIITPLKDASGTIKWYVSIRVDDMDRREAETLKNIQELAGGVAHEFAQPLQVLTIMTSLLEMRPDHKEYIKTIQANVDRITGLVNSLKHITTIKKRDYLTEKIVDLFASSGKNNSEVKRTSILIVEDEDELRHILIDGLHLDGYQCEGAENAESALKLLTTKSYQCILSDINMPGMNGIEFFQKVWEGTFKGRFLFMTGYGLDDEMKHVVNQADGILFKPFQLADLRGLLERFSFDD